MADKLKVELQDENGNIYYLHTSADVVFCEDGTTVEAKLNGKIDEADIIQNATTAATDKVPSAAVAKNLQDQITAQNTKISVVSGQIGVTKILHGELNVQEWIDLFEGTQFGTAIIIMGTETDGAMFIVTKRLQAQCFIQEIYNTGGYQCYRTTGAAETDRPILSLGRNGNYYTRDIIVMGSVR